KIKSQSKAKQSGFKADLFLPAVFGFTCGSGLAREGGLTADLSLPVVPDPTVGASLLAMKVCQSTSMLLT
ncbi:hypothetical protein ACLEJQ_08500, partial [Pseudomonas sp. SMV71]|uniref:hypothetical protein n=1 Tax=Pseudomonas sp. SMV71 TaxID=3390195 RepID=UPI003F85A0D7